MKISLIALFYFLLTLGLPAISGAEEGAPFVLKNDTPSPVTLYIDGEKVCTAPPKATCAKRVAVGWHDVKAEFANKPGVAVEDRFNVPPDGYTWGVY